MHEFWAQDPVVLSLELSVIVGVMIGLVFMARKLSRQGELGGRLRLRLDSQGGLQIFKLIRLGVAVAGVVTLFVTVLPGLTPFADNVDANLGLGGIVLFLLWPLIALQVVVACLPLERQLAKAPVSAWLFMIIGAFVWILIDNTTIRLVFN